MTGVQTCALPICFPVTITGIEDILRTYIRSGGEYVELIDKMKTFITGTKDVPGYLTRYAKQITIDSLQQYKSVFGLIFTCAPSILPFNISGSSDL